MSGICVFTLFNTTKTFPVYHFYIVLILTVVPVLLIATLGLVTGVCA